MATAFTPEQIKQLEAEFQAYMPSKPMLHDVDSAPKAERLAFAGTEWGMLLHVDTGKAGQRNLFINPVVARTLVKGIAQAGTAHKWWARLEEKQVPLAPDLTPSDLETADHVRSIRTTNVSSGLLAVCGSERGGLLFFLRPNFAAAVAWSITRMGRSAVWWDEDYEVIPRALN